MNRRQAGLIPKGSDLLSQGPSCQESDNLTPYLSTTKAAFANRPPGGIAVSPPSLGGLSGQGP